MSSKTTIRNLDPDVFWDAKVLAAQVKMTMGELVTLALERLVEEEWGELENDGIEPFEDQQEVTQQAEVRIVQEAKWDQPL